MYDGEASKDESGAVDGPGRAGHDEAPRISVIVATYQRRDELARTLRELVSMPDRAELIVLDNASSDNTAGMVEQDFPTVKLIRLHRNIGSAARNIGVQQARTPYVAFSDDDSWWMAGALRRATELFDRHPRLGAIAARTLVGSEGMLDPVSQELACSPLPQRSGLPGLPALSFVACSAIIRRSAFLGVGGFDPIFFGGGEERMLAYDLAAAGWGVVYRPDIVARHFPSESRNLVTREVHRRRNEILTLWLRRPLAPAVIASWSLLRSAPEDRLSRMALGQVVTRLPYVLKRRRRLPEFIEAQIRILEAGRA